MKTIAYVDGFNLFFGLLHGGPHKWLDLPGLIARLLSAQDPSSKLVFTKYFTSHIKSKLATNGPAAEQAQKSYIRALEARGKLLSYCGWYQLEKYAAIAYQPVPDKANRVDIWKLEEKETDVRLAVEIYKDLTMGAEISGQIVKPEQVVLVSNDSDFVPIAEHIKKYFPEVRLGVIQPVKTGTGRRASGSLSKLAHWSIGSISTADLDGSQLPIRVPTRKKPCDKPAHW